MKPEPRRTLGRVHAVPPPILSPEIRNAAMTITTAKLADRYGRHPSAVKRWRRQRYIHPINEYSRGPHEPWVFNITETEAALAKIGMYPVGHDKHVPVNQAVRRGVAR